MANGERGEVDVDIDGRTRTLRPSFQALCEIENRTGLTVLELVRLFHEGRFGGQHVAAVVHAGLRAGEGANAPDYDAVGRLVVAAGIRRFAPAVARFLMVLIAGEAGGDAGKKKDAGQR